MLAKLSVYGKDREEARLRMLRALAEYQIDGLKTSIPFHRWMLQQPGFIRGDFDTGTIDRDFKGLLPEVDPEAEAAAMIAAVIHVHEGTIGPAAATPGDATRMSAWKLAGRSGRRAR